MIPGEQEILDAFETRMDNAEAMIEPWHEAMERARQERDQALDACRLAYIRQFLMDARRTCPHQAKHRRIGRLKERVGHTPAGTYVLVGMYDPSSCSIEVPLTPHEIVKNKAHGSGLTTISYCANVPAHLIEFIPDLISEEKPPVKTRSILQDWVQTLGLRHQGVLLTAVRGCDTAPKDDPSKFFVRCYRNVILNPHCGDSEKSRSFIERVDEQELGLRFRAYRKNLDHYPHHYVMHLLHAIEIVGYKHPDVDVSSIWVSFYKTLCHGLHVTPETEDELDARLNADETTFGDRQTA